MSETRSAKERTLRSTQAGGDLIYMQASLNGMTFQLRLEGGEGRAGRSRCTRALR